MTERAGTARGQLSGGEQQAYQPLSVLPGTALTVTMTGTGDADLYVRFDAPATLAAYDCRPLDRAVVGAAPLPAQR